MQGGQALLHSRRSPLLQPTNIFLAAVSHVNFALLQLPLDEVAIAVARGVVTMLQAAEYLVEHAGGVAVIVHHAQRLLKTHKRWGEGCLERCGNALADDFQRIAQTLAGNPDPMQLHPFAVIAITQGSEAPDHLGE